MKYKINEFGVITNPDILFLVGNKDTRNTIEVQYANINNETYAVLSIQTKNKGQSSPLTLDRKVKSIEYFILSKEKEIIYYLSEDDKESELLNKITKKLKEIKDDMKQQTLL